MQIQYFQETDTLYIQLNEQAVVEATDLNENTVLDLDVHGNLVAITSEHARNLTDLLDPPFRQVLPNAQPA